MEIINQIPQSVIERYAIIESEHFISLYSNPKGCFGYISLPKDNETIKVEETPNCINLTVMGKFYLSLWKDVQATHISLF
jgi:hypothetical protein